MPHLVIIQLMFLLINFWLDKYYLFKRQSAQEMHFDMDCVIFFEFSFLFSLLGKLAFRYLMKSEDLAQHFSHPSNIEIISIVFVIAFILFMKGERKDWKL